MCLAQPPGTSLPRDPRSAPLARSPEARRCSPSRGPSPVRIRIAPLAPSSPQTLPGGRTLQALGRRSTSPASRRTALRPAPDGLGQVLVACDTDTVHKHERSGLGSEPPGQVGDSGRIGRRSVPAIAGLDDPHLPDRFPQLRRRRDITCGYEGPGGHTRKHDRAARTQLPRFLAHRLQPPFTASASADSHTNRRGFPCDTTSLSAANAPVAISAPTNAAYTIHAIMTAFLPLVSGASSLLPPAFHPVSTALMRRSSSPVNSRPSTSVASSISAEPWKILFTIRVSARPPARTDSTSGK